MGLRELKIFANEGNFLGFYFCWSIKLYVFSGVDFFANLSYNCSNMVESTGYISKEKYEELKKELEQLKTIERKKNAEDLEYAKSLGDLSENAEYHEARERQADVEDRIIQIEYTLKNSQIVDSHRSGQVEVGTTINIKKDNKEAVFQIVGAEEADMSIGKISYESPLGLALLGHKKGDEVIVTTPKGESKYKIIDIK